MTEIPACSINGQDQTAFDRMMLNLLETVLGQADRPDEMGAYLTQAVQALTGPRMVALIQCNHSFGGDGHALIHVYPPHGHADALVDQPWESLAELAHELDHPDLWLPDDTTSAGALLQRMGRSATIALPLLVGHERVGTMFLFDMPSDSRIDQIKSMLEQLGMAAALVFRNALLYEQQEQIVEQRTRELAASEARYRSYVDHAPIGVFVANAQGQYIEVNQAATEITGYNASELIGMRIPDLIPPEGHELALTHFARTVEMGYASSDEPIPFRRKDGVRRYWAIDAIKLTADRFLGFVRDVTKQLKAEQALQESEERFRTLVESAGLGIGFYDLDGKLLYFNEVAARHMGGQPEQYVGQTIEQLYDRNMARNIRVRFAKAVNSPKAHSYEDQVLLPTGNKYFITTYRRVMDATGDISGVQLISQEITERIRAEQAQRQSQARYQRLFDGAVLGIFQSTPDGHILDVNPAFARMFGYDSPKHALDAITHAYQVYHHPAERDAWIAALQASDQPIVYKTDFVRKDGQRFVGNLHVWQVLDEQGRFLYFEGFVEDVTEIVQAQARIENLSRFPQENRSPVMRIDGNGTLLYANQASQPLLDHWQAQIGAPMPTEWLVFAQSLLNRDEADLLDVSVQGRVYSLDCVPIVEEGYINVYGRDVTDRIQAQTRLQESENRFRTVVQRSPQGVLIHDLEGRLIEVNERYSQNTGYTRQELLTMNVADLDPHATGREDWHIWHALGANDTHRLQVTHIRKDGSTYPAEVFLAPIELDGRKLILATVYDITERVKAEQALKNSEARYRDLFNNAQDAIFLHSIEPDNRPGRFMAVNDQACQALGYTRDELLQMDVTDISPTAASDDETTTAVMGELARGGKITFEAVHRRKDGSHLPVEISAHRFTQDGRAMILSIARDISERKRAEAERQRFQAEIRDQAQRLQQVIDTVPEGVLLLDADGVVLLANPMGVTDLNELADAAPGQRLERLGHRPLSAYLNWPEDTDWHETQANGQAYQIIARPVQAKTKEGGWVVVIRDVTHQREIEERLRQQDRMAVIGQLAGGVAHDFNNLLTGIQGYTELVMAQLVDGDPIWMDLNEVRKASERAASLTRQLLAFSRKQVLQPRAVNLNEIITNMEKMLRRLIGENIVLDTELAPNLSLTMGDTGQLEQVLMNLVVNARDAMPQGGALTLRTDNQHLARQVSRGKLELDPGDYVVLQVIDNGTGMPAKVIDHLFEPFFTTKEQGKGTGLGLATVWGIVTQSGGGIDVQSQEGVGSTFSVYLPKLATKEPAESLAQQGNGPHTGVENVLLVEDDIAVRRLTRRALEEMGYKVLEASLPSQAIHISNQYQGAIALLVSDVIMPEMSGHQLAQRLLKSRPQIKVLYISGYTDADESQHDPNDGNVAWLQKPFRPRDLAAKIRDLLE